MSIQSSMNRIIAEASAFKMYKQHINKEKLKEASELDRIASKGPTTPIPQTKIKTQAGKLKMMRERAFSSARDEAEARGLQKGYFNKVWKGELL